METLAQMLEDYRNGDRGLPSYEELVVLVAQEDVLVQPMAVPDGLRAMIMGVLDSYAIDDGTVAKFNQCVDEVCAAILAATVAAGSVDTEEFRKVTFAYAHAIVNCYVPESSIAWGKVVSFTDAWGAQQRHEGFQEGVAQLQQERDNLLKLAARRREWAEKAEARVKELEFKSYDISDFITIKNGQDITSMMKHIKRSSDATGELRITSSSNGVARTMPDGRIQIIFDSSMEKSSHGVVVHSSNDEPLCGWAMPGFYIWYQ